MFTPKYASPEKSMVNKWFFSSPVWIQDLIYTIRNRFNAEFEVLYKQKLQVINGVRERNKEIRQMMSELGIEEKLWEPSLVCMEQPEILLKVDDSEVTDPVWKHSASNRPASGGSPAEMIELHRARHSQNLEKKKQLSSVKMLLVLFCFSLLIFRSNQRGTWAQRRRSWRIRGWC